MPTDDAAYAQERAAATAPDKPKSAPGRWEYNAVSRVGHLLIGGERIALASEGGLWRIYASGACGKARSYYAAQRAVRKALRGSADADAA